MSPNTLEEADTPTLNRKQYLQIAVWMIALSAASEPGAYDDLVRLVDVFKGMPLLDRRSPLDAMVLQLHLQKQTNPMAQELLNSPGPTSLGKDAVVALLASLVDTIGFNTPIDELREAVFDFAADDDFWDNYAADVKDTEKAVDEAAALIKRSGGVQ